MKLVRDANAKWSPERCRFALTRLLFSLVWRRLPAGVPGAYAIDRDQNTIENYAITIWIVVTVAFYLAPFVTWWLAFPAALIAIEIPIYATGLIFNNRTLNEIALWSTLAIASWWGGWVGKVFYTVVAANIVAFLILLPTRKKILGFAMIAPLIAIALFYERQWLAGIGVIVLSHAFILYPTLTPNAQWLGPVITCFETDRNEVWLTIDDGPADDDAAVRQLLESRGVAATFFVIGKHDGANHSATHPAKTFWCLPPRRIAEEIDGGATSKWFRAPVGMKNPFVHPALEKRGMRLIGWTVRGFDATRDDVEGVTRRIVSRVRPGAIVVLHQGRPWSLRGIERVVDELQRRGYAFVIPSDDRLKTKR